MIDPLADPAATFAALGDAAGAELPVAVAARAQGSAVAGLVSHLHRDHADAGRSRRCSGRRRLGARARLARREDIENLALAQANLALERAGLTRRSLEEWEQAQAGPFTFTALPAVDGLGDPQVSWLVEADGIGVLHLGDNGFHGYWWRMVRRHGPFDVVFAPINGPAVDFLHLQPSSPLAAAMDPEQAALAGELLGAATVVPMHYDGLDRTLVPAGPRCSRAVLGGRPHSYAVRLLEPGESFDPAGTPASLESAR